MDVRYQLSISIGMGLTRALRECSRLAVPSAVFAARSLGCSRPGAAGGGMEKLSFNALLSGAGWLGTVATANESSMQASDAATCYAFLSSGNFL